MNASLGDPAAVTDWTPGQPMCIGDGDAVVIDDLLSPREARSAWSYFCQQRFEPVHRDEFVRAYRFDDGNAYWSNALRFRRTDWQPDKDSGQADEPRSIQSFPEAIKGLLPLCMKLLWNEDISGFVDDVDPWRDIVAQPYLYPAGAGLAWHNDGNKIAAFIYYAHPTWDIEWGGELLIAPGRSSEAFESSARCCANGFAEFYGDRPDLSGIGLGIFVVPKPNRLVVIRRGVRHAIKRVEASSGNTFRATISGFFLSGESDT